MYKFLANRNRMYVNGRLQKPHIDRVAFLDVGSCEPRDTQEPARSSSWTSRVYASIQYQMTETPRDADLRWDLFNNTVLTAQVLLVTRAYCQEHDVSQYRPQLEWAGVPIESASELGMP